MSWEPKQFKGHLLRLIWNPSVQQPETNRIHMANYMDMALERTSPAFYFIKPASDKLSIGYSVIKNDRPSVIHWIDNIHHFLGQMLSVWQVYNLSVTGILDNRAHISWETRGEDYPLIGWEFESITPDKNRLPIIAQLIDTRYNYEMVGLRGCCNYEGKLRWNNITESSVISFRTKTPKFIAKNLAGVAGDHEISLNWDAPDCHYLGSFFRLTLNDQLVEKWLDHKARFHYIGQLERNQKYKIVLEACYNTECLRSEIILRTTISSLKNIVLSPKMDVANGIVTVTCDPKEEVDYFLFTLNNSSDVISEVKKGTCLFVESFPCGEKDFSVHMIAVKIIGDQVLHSDKTILPIINYNCQGLTMIGLLVSGSLILVGLILVLFILYRRSKQYNELKIILPMELEILGEE